MRSRTIASAAVAVVAGLALTSCSGGGGKDAGATPSASPSPSSTVSLPAGVSLTDQGSKLAFGDPATVLYQQSQKRSTALQLTVKDAAQGSLKDFSGFILDDPYKKKASYYYVDVTVKDVGEGDVGGAPVPLWGVDGDNTLLPAVDFTTSFPKCESKPLPKSFGPGDTFATCLVYLAPNHGTLTAVSYRPTEAFNPIVWTGSVSKPKVEQKQHKKKH
jgi:hypothetical protein